jgi:3-(3-hydroxy-phenyl)propionate hydroxylase
LCPNPLLSQGVQLDDEIRNRFALIASSRLTDEQRDELSRRGAAVISATPGNGLDRWLRRAGTRVAIVRPDRTVMQAGRSMDALAAALPPFTTESEL